MNVNLKKNMTYSLAVLVCILASCKPLSQSSLQGVDAVTSGDVNKEESEFCGDAANEGSGKSAEERAVMRVFAALPDKVQSFYGGKANAMQTVTIVDDIEGECKKVIENGPQKATLVSRAKAVGACFSKKEVTINGEKTMRPHVIIKRDAKIINGSLLSNYVFIFLSSAIDVALANNSDENVRVLVDFVNKTRAQLAKNVVTDLKGEIGEDKKSVLSALNKAFPSASGEATLADNKDFQNFLVSEFAESYYCSAASYNHLINPSFNDPKKKWSAETRKNIDYMFFMFGPFHYNPSQPTKESDEK